jgi:hypothetical protein
MRASPSSESLRAQDLVIALRCALGLPPLNRPPTDDIPAHVSADLEVENVNARGLIAWAIAGLELLSHGRLPTMAAAVITAKRTVAVIAMDAQGGSLSSAARLLRTGSRNVRGILEEAGCWPWFGTSHRYPLAPVSWCPCAGPDDAWRTDEDANTTRARDLVIALRCALGLPPLERSPADDIPTHLAADLEVEGLNPYRLIAWVIAGLELFSDGKLPTLDAAIVTAKRTVAVVAMDAQLGSLSSAARLLYTGSRNVRRILEEAKCWPWVELLHRHPPVEPISWCRCAGDDGYVTANAAE